jgi:hypothetical protein
MFAGLAWLVLIASRKEKPQTPDEQAVEATRAEPRRQPEEECSGDGFAFRVYAAIVRYFPDPS